MLLTLDEIKRQLQLEEQDTLEDEQLTVFGIAAEHALQNRTNRQFFLTANDVPPGCVWWLALDENTDVKLAMLLLVGHFYANREATTDEALRKIPLGVDMLIGHHVVLYPEYPPDTK
ncbi:head-tail connector protein [Vibrio sp. SCSIO 43136]|uniref:head-tail connector protein n=1 Tax=Vibrio sp. SCSIO 43136 TaxID=2819101 RepID=UPI002074DCEF|nr:head-tail connector protein [Vibrio sp. SCSIO 43136]USD68132.1 phage gp6-like head-tail connector protein [Vibrio sp. SCSIO 43136]